MTTEEFAALLDFGEDTWLDWKRDFPDELLKGKSTPGWEKGKGILLKDLIAIANSDDGREDGYLVYGVKDMKTRRQVYGISGKSWDDADFQTLAANTFDPLPRFHYVELEYETHLVGIFRITRIPEYPHVCVKSIGGILYDGQVWYRRGSGNAVAHRDELERMITMKTPFTFFQSDDSVLLDVINKLEKEGWIVNLPRLQEKDSKLAQGYKLAYYPGTRREIWVGYWNGQYEHILMLRTQRNSTG